MTTRVLIVDDSALARKVLSDTLARDPEIEVVGTAGDPFEASERIEQLAPDVLTLDFELPRMNGLTFLRSLMRHYPLPVIIVSSYTPRGSRLAMDALEAGAVDIVPKPGMKYRLAEMSTELTTKVKAAAMARLDGAAAARPAQFKRELAAREQSGGAGEAPAARPARTGQHGAPQVASRPGAPAAPVLVLPRIERAFDPERVIVIGSSTGGTQALQYILSRLPDNMPPILVVQHMPAGFTRAFADRMNTLSSLEVKEAEPGDSAGRGRVLIAPGDLHMRLRRRGPRYRVEIDDGPRVCRQRPSVEVLYRSAAEAAGAHVIGVILTGMGADGADGMLALKQAGATNVAEDEASCVVFGMPKEAIRRGAVDHVVHLHDIPETLVRLL